MVIAVPPTGNTVAAEVAARAGLPFAPAWRRPPAKPSSNPAASAARAILIAGPAQLPTASAVDGRPSRSRRRHRQCRPIPQPGPNPMRRTFTMHGRFHIPDNKSQRSPHASDSCTPRRARVPPPPSSLTPGPKFRRNIYRSIKDINERLERALAAVPDRTRTSGEPLRTTSQVRELRSRNTSQWIGSMNEQSSRHFRNWLVALRVVTLPDVIETSRTSSAARTSCARMMCSS